MPITYSQYYLDPSDYNSLDVVLIGQSVEDEEELSELELRLAALASAAKGAARTLEEAGSEKSSSSQPVQLRQSSSRDRRGNLI